MHYDSGGGVTPRHVLPDALVLAATCWYYAHPWLCFSRKEAKVRRDRHTLTYDVFLSWYAFRTYQSARRAEAVHFREGGRQLVPGVSVRVCVRVDYRTVPCN